MQVKGVRLYAKDDIRLEEFELPEIKDDEILVKVMSDSICMSTWKMVKQGANHKRVPADVYDHPVIIGHEFAGDIVNAYNLPLTCICYLLKYKIHAKYILAQGNYF